MMTLSRAEETNIEIEAAYQEYIIKKALQSLNYRFDPQGHLITEVHLTEDDYQEIIKSLKRKETIPGNTAKEQIEFLLCARITETTICNLDVLQHSALQQTWLTWAKTQSMVQEDQSRQSMVQEDQSRLGQAVDAFMQSSNRSSVICLQEEMEMHMHLCLRGLMQAMSSFNLELLDIQHIASSINEEVRRVFQRALVESFKDGHIDVSLLNKQLDEARVPLAEMVKRKLMNACFSKIEAFGEHYMQRHNQQPQRFSFELLTATGADYLRTDSRNQTVTRIEATEETAHNKQEGKQAHRVLHRNHCVLQEQDQVQQLRITPPTHLHLESRVPSIALLKPNHKEAVDDVCEKLTQSRTYLEKQIAHQSREYYERPMVYNLLTSLRWKSMDRLDNFQRESAARILKGAHQFNKQQIQSGHATRLWYVQNIPVNQHGDSLGDGSLMDSTKEATLMAEIAMLSTLRYGNDLPLEIQKKIDKIYTQLHKCYENFLKSHEDFPAGEKGYFCNSPEGLEAIQKLTKFKDKELLHSPQQTASDASLESLASLTLIRLIAENKHYELQFGTLIQSLSLFLEPVSQAGCKSANERFQMVAGREELLQSLSWRKASTYSPEEEAFVQSLKAYSAGTGSLVEVQKTLDCAYNAHNLAGSVSVISLEDQGAASKVQHSTRGSGGRLGSSEVNTNIAETRELTFLHQEHASKLQSHKMNYAVELHKAFQEAEIFNYQQRQLEFKIRFIKPEQFNTPENLKNHLGTRLFGDSKWTKQIHQHYKQYNSKSSH